MQKKGPRLTGPPPTTKLWCKQVCLLSPASQYMQLAAHARLGWAAAERAAARQTCHCCCRAVRGGGPRAAPSCRCCISCGCCCRRRRCHLCCSGSSGLACATGRGCTILGSPPTPAAAPPAPASAPAASPAAPAALGKALCCGGICRWVAGAWRATAAAAAPAGVTSSMQIRPAHQTSQWAASAAPDFCADYTMQ